MIYQWKGNAPAPPIPAQVAGEELERIRIRQNGRLGSADVVREASDPANPLHPAFEWDDSKAAHSWRVEQAGHMILTIIVQVERPNREPVVTRGFVSVRRDDDRSYTSVAHALSDEELRAQVIADAWRELVAWRQRHAELIEFARIFAEIDQARAA